MRTRCVGPLSPYGTSKLAAEEYLATWNRLYDTRHVALRLGNVYGPRQDPHGEAGVVAIFLSRIRDGQPATIYGDGGQTRDYVFVGDVVRAFVGAVGADGAVFNVGTGEETSVVDLWRACQAAAETAAESVQAPPRLGEIQRSCLDPRRAGTTLRLACGSAARGRAARDMGVDPGGMTHGRANGFASWTIRFASIASSSPSGPGGRQPCSIAVIAAVELVLLIVVGGALLAKPGTETGRPTPKAKAKAAARPRRRARSLRPCARRRSCRRSSRDARFAWSSSTGTAVRARPQRRRPG